MEFIKRHWLQLIIATAMLVRMPHMGATLWYDEAWTQWIAGLPFECMLSAVAGDVHPPLFFCLEWLIGRWSVAPAAMRLMPLVFSLASIWMVVKVAQEFELEIAAQAAAAMIMALSPFQIYYANEARAYALLEFVFLVQVYFAARRNYAGFGIASAVALYTHNYGFIYSFVVGAWMLSRDIRWNNLRGAVRASIGTCLAGAGALVAYAPWSGVLAGQLSAVREGWWATPPTVFDLLSTFCLFTFGDYKSLRALLGMAAGISLLMFVIVKAQRCKLSNLPWLCFGPVVVSVVISCLVQPMFLARALIGSGALYCLLIGWALMHRVGLFTRAMLVLVLLPIFASGAIEDTARIQITERMDPVSVAAIIQRHAKPGDSIWHSDIATIVELHQFGLPQAQYLRRMSGPLGGWYSEQTRAALGIQDEDFSALGGAVWYVRGISPIPQDDDQMLAQDILSRPHTLIYQRMDRHGLFGVEVYRVQAGAITFSQR